MGAPKNSSMAMPPMPVNRGAPRAMASTSTPDPAQTSQARSPAGTRARAMARPMARSEMVRPFQPRLPYQARRRAMKVKPRGMMHCTHHIGTPPGSATPPWLSAYTRCTDA
jgi:hypothetical protein